MTGEIEVQNQVGRPTVMTTDTIAKLIEIFKLDVTIETACAYAKIDKATYFRHYKDDLDFATKIDEARNYARIVAGNLVMDAIINKKDVASARWFLEKKYPQEFGGQQINVISNNQTKVEFVLADDIIKKDESITP